MKYLFLSLFLLGCGGSGGSSTTSFIETDCHEEQAPPPEQMQEVFRIAGEKSVPIVGKLDVGGGTIIVCHGSFDNNETTVTDNSTDETKKLLADLRSGSVTRLELH